MKSYSRPLFLLCVFVLFTISLTLQGQQNSQSDIVTGRHFTFAFPHCAKEQTEGTRGSATFEIWVSSEKNTTVYVSTKSHGSFQTKVIANKVSKIPLNDSYMNTKNEIIQNLGIELTSDEPVSVTAFISYRWSGEAFKVIPTHSLGTRYRTLNLYQDETDEIKPSQIVLVATEDKTFVKITPTFNTSSTQKGKIGVIALDKGQTYLIHNEKKASYTHIGGDLTGTLIEADKPIAVISGHTKGSFPRYSKQMLGRPANFMRNTLVEMMLPENMLGTEYISAPIKYQNRYVKNIDPDDIGDMIRFVATVDGTIVTQMRQDGTGYKPISKTLKAGEYHEITNMEIAAAYKSNFPVLVGQYGKAWRNQYITSETKADNTQNPSRNGSGMLLTLTPFDKWYSHSIFYSPTGIDNFIYLTFRTKDSALIILDDSLICKKYRKDIVQITGTPYSYLATQIANGKHSIKGAKFAAYSYGNWDYSKDGFAYGYPTAHRYNKLCDDSIYIQIQDSCGSVKGNVSIISKDMCSGIHSVSFIEDTSYNFRFKQNAIEPKLTTAKFELSAIERLKPAKAMIEVITLSGKKYIHWIDYKDLCSDEIVSYTFPKDTTCGTFTTVVKVSPDDDNGAVIDTIETSIDNYTYKVSNISDKEVGYKVTVKQPDYEAKATITVKTKRGFYSTKEYKYVPKKLHLDNMELYLGKIKIGDKACKPIVLRNNSNDTMIVIISDLNMNKVFSIEGVSAIPVIIPAKDSFTYRICATCKSDLKGTISTSFVLLYLCGNKTVGSVAFDVDTIVSSINDNSVTNEQQHSYYSVYNVVYDGTKLPQEFDILQNTTLTYSLYDNIGQQISTGIITSIDDLLSQTDFAFPMGISTFLIETKSQNGRKYLFRVCRF